MPVPNILFPGLKCRSYMITLNQSFTVAQCAWLSCHFDIRPNVTLFFFSCSPRRRINTPYSSFQLFNEWNRCYFWVFVPTGANFHSIPLIPVISKTFFYVILHRLYLRIKYCDKILNYDSATFCLHNPHTCSLLLSALFYFHILFVINARKNTSY